MNEKFKKKIGESRKTNNPNNFEHKKLEYLRDIAQKLNNLNRSLIDLTEAIENLSKSFK